MNILVTGSTGFIGKRLVELLLLQNYNVRVLLRETSNIDKIDKRVKIFQGNLFDDSFLKSSMKDIDIVFHLAALRGETGLTWKAYEKSNILLTEKLLEASRNVKRFIFCSTVGVMGFGTGLSEKSPLNPEGYYHISKSEAEKLCLNYENCIIVRPSIVYGPGDNGFLYKLINLIKKKRFIIVGNGKNKIHMVHIDNLCKGFINTALNGNLREIYIIADSKALTVSEMSQVISKKLGVNIPSVTVPGIIALPLAFLFQKCFSIVFPGKEPFISVPKVNILSLNQDFDTSKVLSIGYNPDIEPEKGIGGMTDLC
ncbi:MAG TPA: NAD(P)-dependent oxidoreductase [Atribacterota bacterium]|nr:NAD(P)-dependent oxidoreductase [Atribacterota bacterium]